MSEVSNNKYNELIKTGQNRESFLSKFRNLFMTKEADNISVFDDVSDDETVDLIFNTIASASNDGEFGDTLVISQKDIDIIKKYDGDESSISENDIILYFEDKIKSVEDELKNATVQDEEESPMDDSSTKTITTAATIDMLFLLKQLKIQLATNKKNNLQHEINELIKKLEDKQQKEIIKLNNSIKKTVEETNKKNEELSNQQSKLNEFEVEIERKKSELENTVDEKRKQELQHEISQLNSNITRTKTSINSTTQSIKNSKSEYASLVKKLNATINKTKNTEEIQSKYNEIARTDIELEEEISNIDSKIEHYQAQALTTAQNIGKQKAYYSDIASGQIQSSDVTKSAAEALSKATGEIGTREATGRNDGKAVAKYRGGVDNGAAWCASFVSWCYKGNNVFGYQASVNGIMLSAQKKGLYSDKKDYVPKPGDVMIQKNNGASHTGIVEKVDADGTIHTIEGNAGNMVKRVTYRVGSKGYNTISGYVRMSEVENTQ